MSATVHQGVDVGAKRIGEYVNDNYELSLDAHLNGLECRASITVFNTEDSIAPAELIAILRNNNITDSVDLEQVAVFCSEAALGENPTNVLLAKGEVAVNGRDGWFELVVTTGQEDAALDEDEFGRVDFKSIQAFSNVEPGQHIGNIYLPTEGTPGKTIYGEPIAPYPGKPCGIIAGTGVHFSDDGTQVIADQAGRVLFENNVLSISEEFVVNGDVDLAIGHISFNGFVNIKGDVLDDFNSTATKGISISGAVGNCRITSEGPVTLGTMAGMGKGKIICKGSLKARYLNHVTVECWGDVDISHEVRNSTIKSTGRVMVPKGLVTGGEIIALEGIEAKILGSRSGTKTHLTSGVFFPETDRLNYLRTRLKSLSIQLAKISDTLKTLNGKNLSNLRPALRDAFQLRIDILTQRQLNLETEREQLAEELLQFSLEEHPTANAKINVLGAVKEGIIVSLGESSEEIPSDISGPASIIENSDEGGFRFLTYSPLSSHADSVAP